MESSNWKYYKLEDLFNISVSKYKIATMVKHHMFLHHQIIMV